MQKFNPGDIIEVDFPFEDTSEKKIRPAVVICDYENSFIAMKITSKHKGRKWDVEIPKTNFNGLSVDSVIQIDKIIEIDKKKLCSIIPRGSLNALQLAIIKERLQEFIKLKS